MEQDKNCVGSYIQHASEKNGVHPSDANSRGEHGDIMTPMMFLVKCYMMLSSLI